MWFICKKALLTKDNLAKRRWHGCTKCVFCGLQESVDYLFFACSFVKSVCKVIQFTFGLTPPTNVTNLSGTWLNGIDKVTKAEIRIGICDFL